MKKQFIVAVSAIIAIHSSIAAEPVKGNAKPSVKPTPSATPEAVGKWTLDDAQKFLSSLSGKGASNLPKYKDKQSPLKSTVEAIDEMTGGADIRIKMSNISKSLLLFGGLTQRYSNAAAQGNNYDEEIFHLVCASMKTSSLAIESLDKFKATLDKNNPSYHQNVAGLEKMKSDAAQQLLLMHMMIENRDELNDQTRALAAKYLLDYGAVIVQNTPETLKPGVKIKFQQLLEGEKNPEIKTQIAKFLGYFDL